MDKPFALQSSPSRYGLHTVSLLLALMAPAGALAHPGHGDAGFWSGLAHAFHGLDHVLAALAVGLWGWRLGGRALWVLPLAFVCAMAAGIGLAAGGIAVPAIEPMIAASVLVLGMVLAFDVRLGATVAAALVAVFAPFHACAHVAEMPATFGMLAYAAGLLASTALLHAAGTGAAVALRGHALALRVLAAPIALAGIAMVVARVS